MRHTRPSPAGTRTTAPTTTSKSARRLGVAAGVLGPGPYHPIPAVPARGPARPRTGTSCDAWPSPGARLGCRATGSARTRPGSPRPTPGPTTVGTQRRRRLRVRARPIASSELGGRRASPGRGRSARQRREPAQAGLQLPRPTTGPSPAPAPSGRGTLVSIRGGLRRQASSAARRRGVVEGDHDVAAGAPRLRSGSTAPRSR